jgi:S-adenosylmethionine/arginine decarboxylase-like enzyme
MAITEKNIMTAKLTSHHFSSVLPLIDGHEHLSPERLLEILRDAVRKSELNVVTDVTASFKPHGATAIVVLEESHAAVHLWPELGLATVDIHVCDYSGDNESKAKHLAQILGEQLANDSSLANWKQLTTSNSARTAVAMSKESHQKELTQS